MKTRSKHSGPEWREIVRLVQIQCKQGSTISEACYEAGISTTSYHAWRQELGFPLITEVRRQARGRVPRVVPVKPERVPRVGEGESPAGAPVVTPVVPEVALDKIDKLLNKQEMWTRSAVANMRRRARQQQLDECDANRKRADADRDKS